MHGALLAKALMADGDVRCVGMGGPAMAEAGVEAQFDISELSLMGLVEVLGHLPRIIGLMRRMYLKLRDMRPDAVVLVDSPDFNFFVARMAKRLGIPAYYYICPQVWAWRSGRVKFLRNYVRRTLCILPFEKPFLQKHGYDADYVGHPLTDQIPLESLRAIEPEQGRVCILPGSRSKEISTLLPEFVRAARIIAKRRPDATFTLVQAPGVNREKLAAHLPQDLKFEIVPPSDRYVHMRRAQAIIAASGTVALETALIGTPTVVAYKLSPLTYALGKRVVNVDFVSLPNLILGKQVFPELLQENANADNIAAYASMWLTNPEAENQARGQLDDLAEKVGAPGAPARAAAIIFSDLKSLNG